MSVFTDDDLKRLKDWLNTKSAPTNWSDNDSDKILALLARLEASEAVIKRALQYKHHFHGEPCGCDNCKSVHTWRKAAGKSTGGGE